MTDNTQLIKLWHKYQCTKDRETRDRLIEGYAHLVKYVAGRMRIHFGDHIEYDDLVGYGIFGLIDAIDRFDSSKGAKFETYASLRIRGAILDSVRENDWVPRSLRQKQKEIEKAFQEIENRVGRPALDEEVASFLQMPVEELQGYLKDFYNSTVISIDDLISESGDVFSNTGNLAEYEPEHQLHVQQIKEELAQAIEFLPDKERQVILLYYFEELTLKEISKVLEVTESRISQIHSKAVLRLKGKLQNFRSEMLSVH